MSELKCVGAKKFTVSYTHREPDKIGISGVGQVYCPLNGGTLSYEWIENLQYRRYFDIGYYAFGDDRACGETYAYICSGYKLDSVGLEFQKINNGWAIPVSSESPDTYAFAVGYQKDIVDILLESGDLNDPRLEAQGVDFTPRNPPGYTTSYALYRMSSCSRNYPSFRQPALEITSRQTFRWGNPGRWYLSIKEGGQEIHQYGTPETGFVGSGEYGWDEPNKTVIYQPSTSILKTYTFNKYQAGSGIRMTLQPWSATRYSPSDRRIYLGGQRYRMVFEEIDKQGEIVRDFHS